MILDETAQGFAGSRDEVLIVGIRDEHRFRSCHLALYFPILANKFQISLGGTRTREMDVHLVTVEIG